MLLLLPFARSLHPVIGLLGGRVASIEVVLPYRHAARLTASTLRHWHRVTLVQSDVLHLLGIVQIRLESILRDSVPLNSHCSIALIVLHITVL